MYILEENLAKNYTNILKYTYTSTSTCYSVNTIIYILYMLSDLYIYSLYIYILTLHLILPFTLFFFQNIRRSVFHIA